MNSDEVCAVVGGVEVYASLFREGRATWYKDDYYGWCYDVDSDPMFVGFYVYDEDALPVDATYEQVVEAERKMIDEYWDIYSYEGLI